MKKYFGIIALFLLAIVNLGCEEDDSLQISPPEAVFELNVPTLTNINLNFDLPDNPAFTITWTDDLTDGASGYMIELDNAESFDTPMTIGSSTSNTFTMTVAEFNNLVLGEGAEAFEPFPVYMRVLSGSLISNVVSFSVSSYAETPPVISSPDNEFDLVLVETTPNDIALTVEWNDPDFGDNSSVEVVYEIDFAQAGTEFASPVAYTMSDNGDQTIMSPISITHEKLNEIALDSGLNAEEVGNLDLRIEASIVLPEGDMVRYSEPVTIAVTPYSVELAPILYVVGAGAVDAGWSWDNPVELPLQGTKYSGNINLVNDAFRFFEINNDWDSGLNYPYFESVGYTIDDNFENANDNDSNFRFVGDPGQYFIEIDTETRTIVLGPPQLGPNCNFDQLWLVGAGIVDAGWSWDTPVALPCTGQGTYSGNVEFTNDAFRFFTENTNWDSGTNYPGYAGNGYTIDGNFNDAMDGDNNFFFNGTPGTYYLTVDDINKTITLGPEQADCEFEQLWLVGAGIVDAGWSWDTPVALPCVSPGVYSGDVAFTNDAFRFFTENTNWDSGLNYPYYEGEGYTIDSDFNNANDGDSNFFFNTTPGTYTLTVNTVDLSITVNPVGANCDLDQLWLVGAGVVDAGWSWDTPVAMPCSGDGVYSVDVNLTNDAFRFFEINNDWDSGNNYPFYENDGYTIDALLENANDGDNNFYFNGTPGTYTLALDTVNKTITID